MAAPHSALPSYYARREASLVTLMRAVRAIHMPERRGRRRCDVCSSCGMSWPCDTAALIDNSNL